VPQRASAIATRIGTWPVAALLLLVAAAPVSAAPGEGSLSAAAETVAARLAAECSSPEVVGLQVSAPGAEGLTAPLATALGGSLSRRGFAVALLAAVPGAAAEDAARSLELDRLLRVTAGLLPGRRELVLAVESVPVRPSFFLQRAPGIRPGGALWTTSVAADETTLLLARTGARPPPGGSSLWVRPLFRVAEPVLALAAGDVAGNGEVFLALVTPSAVEVLDAGGAPRARHALPRAAGPRHGAATAAVGALGAGRIGFQVAGSGPGALLRLADGELRPVASLPLAPLTAGDHGALYGSFVPGKAALSDLLVTAPEAAARPRSAREHAAFASAPRPGRVAHAWVSGEGVLTLLGPDLEPVGAPLEGIGSGVALADLDGDGEPEVVASSAEPGPDDRVRVLRVGPASSPGAAPAPMLESARVPGAILAGTAADLTGDGLDDAVLAAHLPGGGTQLWLVTADPRFAEAR